MEKAKKKDQNLGENLKNFLPDKKIFEVINRHGWENLRRHMQIFTKQNLKYIAFFSIYLSTAESTICLRENLSL